MEVQFSGMKLDAGQKSMIEELGGKLCKECEINVLHVNTKAHRKAGNRYSYTTQVRAESGSIVKSVSSEGWVFKDTVHEAFKKLGKELKNQRKSFVSRIFKRLR
jgi:hypothetical protein